jgi:hypothetical protein
VYTVNEVDVPNEELTRLKLNSGSNKHRLIALSDLLMKHLAASDTNASCLVDADQDRVLGRCVDVPHLLYTDYCCMEMYCLNEKTLKKFLVLGCNLGADSVLDFMAIAELILPAVFSVRALNEKLSLVATLPSFERGLRNERDLSTFDAEKYFQAFVHGNNLHSRSAELLPAFRSLIAALDVDLRNKAHGHDLVALLFEFIHKKGAMRFQNKARDTLEYGGRLLANAMDVATTFSERLFERIEHAVRGNIVLWGKV